MGSTILSWLFSIGGGLGLLGLAAFLLEHGLNIEQIPVLAAEGRNDEKINGKDQ